MKNEFNRLVIENIKVAKNIIETEPTIKFNKLEI